RPTHPMRIGHVAEENCADCLGEKKASPISRERTACSSRFVVRPVVGSVSLVQSMEPFEPPSRDREQRKFETHDESAVEKPSLYKMVSDEDRVIAGGASAANTEGRPLQTEFLGDQRQGNVMALI